MHRAAFEYRGIRTPVRINLGGDAQLAPISRDVVGSVEHGLRHRFVAFQAAGPDPLVLLAHLQTALVGRSEPVVARRLFRVGQIVPLGGRHVLQAALGEPLAGGVLGLGFQRLLALGREVPQLRHETAALLEPCQVLLGKELRRPLGHLSPGKGGVDAVVVANRDRIHLVVVTLRAAQRHRQERLPDAVDHIVEVGLPGHLLRHHRGAPRPHAQEARSHEHFRIAAGQFVAGKLLDHELVVWLVCVERTDDVIPITPSVGPLVVIRVPGRVRVASDIEPVPSPLLAVVRARQQPVDQPLPSAGSSVGEVRPSLLGCGRKAG